MNNAKFQSELEALGQRLQETLLYHSPLLQLQVRCGIRQEVLLVLVEHLLHIEPDPERTFTQLQQSLTEVAPTLFRSGLVHYATGHGRSLPVRAYLRIVGYQEPYQSQMFTLEPLAPEAGSAASPTKVAPARPAALPPPVPVILSPTTTAREVVQPEIQPAVRPEIQLDTAQPETAEPIDNESIIAEPEAAETPESSTEQTPTLEAVELQDAGSIGDEAVADPIAEPIIQAEPSGTSIDFKETIVSKIEEPIAEQTAIAYEEQPQLETQLEWAAEAEIHEWSALEESIVEFDLSEPEIVEAEPNELEPVQAEITAPEIAEPEAIALEEPIVEPELNEPVQPEIVAPETVEPEIAELEAIAPEVVLPEAIAPEVAEPEAIAPEIIESEIIESETAVREAAIRITSFPSSELLKDRLLDASIQTPPPPAPERVSPERVDQHPDHHPAKSFGARFSLSTLMLGGAVGLFALVSGAYIVSRPCVLGSACEPLQKAQQLNQKATQTITTTESALAVVEAYDQLTEASYLLGTIPSWSGQYKSAQSLQADYESKSKRVRQVVKALKHANSAAQKSQNPPHPLPEWRRIQWDWREAIATLEKVPPDSPVLALAKKKLAEYKVNLSNTDQRVLVEQSAQDKVTTARKTAEVAENRAGIATNSESWQQVYLTWKAAINLLQEVPQGTMAYAEAQQFLSLYQPKMSEADNQRNQEQVSTGSYQEAINLAKQARNWERKNQWTQAVVSWRSALTNVQKIPQSTVYYTQAQPLISEYKAALTQAEANLNRSSAMQNVKPNLDRACLGNYPGAPTGVSKVCTYTLSSEGIRIQITPQYDQAVENAIARAQTQGTANARTAVTAQVNSLLQDLAEIGKMAQVPIALYNSDGSIFANYMPDKAGYVVR